MRVTAIIVCLSLAALPTLLFAGLINRSTKSGATTSFATSKTLGHVLNVANLDTDLNNAYSAINGGIDSVNVTNGSLMSSDLNNNAGITTGQILDGTLLATDFSASLNLPSSQILDGTIVNADISPSAAIAGDKLSVGVALRSVAGNAPLTTTGFVVTGVETQLVSMVVSVNGATNVLITGGASVLVSWTNNGATPARLRLRYKVDGVTFHEVNHYAQPPVGSIYALPVPLPTIFDLTIRATGARTYTITAEYIGSGGGGFGGGTGVIEGTMTALEIR